MATQAKAMSYLGTGPLVGNGDRFTSAVGRWLPRSAFVGRAARHKGHRTAPFQDDRNRVPMGKRAELMISQYRKRPERDQCHLRRHARIIATSARSATCCARNLLEWAIKSFSTQKKRTSVIRNDARLAHRRREVGDRQFVTALARGLAILRCYRTGEVYLSNQELARRSGLAKPTVSRLTYTLTRMAFLNYSPAREEYALGPGVLVLGHTYLTALKVREIAQPMMQALADSGAGGRRPWASTTACTWWSVEVLSRQPDLQAACGSGRASAAESDCPGPSQPGCHACCATGRGGGGSGAATGAGEPGGAWWPRVLESLREYDKLGFVLSCGEWTPELFAVGVPLSTDDGNRVLSLSCSGPAHGMSRKRLVAEVGPLPWCSASGTGSRRRWRSFSRRRKMSPPSHERRLHIVTPERDVSPVTGVAWRLPTRSS